MKFNLRYFTAGEQVIFPDAHSVNGETPACVGGNLSPGMLLSAYRQGFFPWFNEGDSQVLWWSPDPRFVVFPNEIHVSHTVKKLLRKKNWRVVLDRNFPAVIKHCATAPRREQNGTWITAEIITGYKELHSLGFAHSVEVYLEEKLVGGLYGVALGSIFFGESMFSLLPDVSKIAFVALCNFLKENKFSIIDSQVYTVHVDSLGGCEIPRPSYLNHLKKALARPSLAVSAWQQRDITHYLEQYTQGK